MPLTWNLTAISNHEDLWISDGFSLLPRADIKDLDKAQGPWVQDETAENGYRLATDEEIAPSEEQPPLYAEMFRMNGVTNTLIWMTIPVGIPKITKENAAEFLRRLKVLEEENGGRLMGTADGPVFFTLERVERHIGLSTNASKVAKQIFNHRYGIPDEGR